MFTFLPKVLKGFVYATQGILSMSTERNMKVHVFAALCVVMLGNFLQISLNEWFITLILIAGVFSLEMLNTAIEELSNIVRDELKLDYKATQKARDVAAGAVFIFSIVAAIIGLRIFLPKVIALMWIYTQY